MLRRRQRLQFSEERRNLFVACDSAELFFRNQESRPDPALSLVRAELRVLLRAAGDQEGKRPWGVRSSTGDLACRPGPMRKELRIARRHTDRYPGAVSTENCGSQQLQDLACRPGVDAQKIARAVVFAATPSLKYRPLVADRRSRVSPRTDVQGIAYR